jgi:pimeloyl-ACP methyl ester carboxylesterase
MVETNFYNIDDEQKLAFSQVIGDKNKKNLPGVVFLSGLKSDKEGTKAIFLSKWARKNKRDFLRFDYRGHGSSTGKFEDTSISDWVEDTVRVVLGLTSGPQILVGSSLGGWISLLFARKYPEKVAGIIGIAAAPDFTAKYRNSNLNEAQRNELSNTGKLSFPSEYFEEPLSISKRLIQDGNRHLVLKKDQNIFCPVRLFHGSVDEDVPLSTSIQILKRLRSDNMKLQIVKGIDHRFSTTECLKLIQEAVEEVSLL